MFDIFAKTSSHKTLIRKDWRICNIGADEKWPDPMRCLRARARCSLCVAVPEMSYQLASQDEGIKLLWQPIRPWFEDLGSARRLCLVAITSALILYLHAIHNMAVCVFVRYRDRIKGWAWRFPRLSHFHFHLRAKGSPANIGTSMSCRATKHREKQTRSPSL